MTDEAPAPRNKVSSYDDTEQPPDENKRSADAPTDAELEQMRRASRARRFAQSPEGHAAYKESVEIVGKGGSDIPDTKAPSRGDPGTIESTTRRTGVRGIIDDIVEGPRRAKERAQEIGYAAEKKYDQVRGAPARAAATQTYIQRMAELNLKFRRGQITEAMYADRSSRYLAERDASARPLELRTRDEVIDIGRNLAKGASEVGAKVREEYKPSPVPKFKVQRGTRKATATKGTVVSPAKKQIRFESPINFGSGGILGGGASAGSVGIDLTRSIFSREPEQPHRQSKRSKR